MSDIFISYASTDRERIIPIVQILERSGWSVWWDRKIPIGRTFDEVIEEAIDAAKCVIVVWTHSSVTSKWVRTEAGEGERRGILIPILLDDTSIPLAFRRIETAQLFDWDGVSLDHPEIGILMEAVRTSMEKPPLTRTDFDNEIGEDAVNRQRESQGIKSTEPQSVSTANDGKTKRKANSAVPNWVWISVGIVGIIILFMVGFGMFNSFNNGGSTTQLSTIESASGVSHLSISQLEGCFVEFFENVEENRIAFMEVGAADFDIIGPSQTKSETLGILFTENNAPIGALKFNFRTNGETFNIEAVIDNTCIQVEYDNVDRPGNTVLQNWDRMGFQFQEQIYLLRLGYGSGEISVNYFTKVVE